MPQWLRFRASQRVASRRPGGALREQGDALRLPALDFAAQPRGLGGEGESGLLGGDGGALQDADFVPAFVALPGAGEGLALGADFAFCGGLCTPRWSFREKRRRAVPARCVRCSASLWAGWL